MSRGAADALMDGAKRGGDDALKGVAKGGAEAAEGGLRSAAKRLPWLRAGGAVGLGVGTVYVMSNVSSALGEGAAEWVNDFTGGNCNEKADDQGLEEGTDEFREEVEECQDAAAVRIMVATGLGVVCLFGFLYFIIKK